jgi:hypothetical protein
MWKKIAIAGGACVAVAGAGGAALAASGSSTPTPGSPASSTSTSSGAPSSSTGKHAKPDKSAAKHKGADALRKALHAQWVTKGKDGKFVTHDAIRGSVTAVSPTSITVQSADKKSETFHLTNDTKVRIRANGKGTKGTIAQVHTGDTALVLGTGTTTLTARGIVAGGK